MERIQRGKIVTMDNSEITSNIRKAKTGQMSKEVQVFLTQWFQKQCEDLWKEFCAVKCKGKTDKQVVIEFLEIQAKATTINSLQADLVRTEYEGAVADDELKKIYSELIEKNPQQFK